MGAEVLARSVEWSWLAVTAAAAFTWALVVAPVLFVWFVFKSEKLRNGNYKLPPGPPRWPIIGNMNVLMDGTKPVHQVIDELSKVHGPIMLLKVGVQNLVFVSDPAMTVQFLKTQDHYFANRPAALLSGSGRYLLYGEDDIILCQQGEFHSFIRKLVVSELLSGKKLQGFQTIRMEEQTSIIRAAWEASLRNESIDMRDLMNALTINVITRMAFNRRFFVSGITDKFTSKGQQQWSILIPEMTERFGQVLAETVHPSLKWIDVLTGVRKGMQSWFRRCDALLQNILEEHQQYLDGLSPKELEEYEAKDFMDVMLLLRHGEHANHFTDRIIKGVALDLLVAGSDTSATTIEWAMAELVMNADVMQKIQEEVDSVVGFDRCVLESDTLRMPYLAAVVKETFRLHPPLPWLLPHSSPLDRKVGGYDIPAESFVHFNIYGMSRNASFWENPLKFNPDRFLNTDAVVDIKGTHPQLLPFGTGRRSCPGIAMTVAIVHSTLARLVHSFNWSVPDGAAPELDMSERHGPIAAKCISLKARPTPRLGLHLYT